VIEHMQTPPVPPSERTELPIPQDLERIVLACLAKQPAERPRSAQELAKMLAACPLETPWNEERAERWWRKHRPQAEGRSD